MNKEKMNGRELTEKEMEMVSGGDMIKIRKVGCRWQDNDLPCNTSSKGQLSQCATYTKNN